jgi:hypothetical protein
LCFEFISEVLNDVDACFDKKSHRGFYGIIFL